MVKFRITPHHNPLISTQFLKTEAGKFTKGKIYDVYDVDFPTGRAITASDDGSIKFIELGFFTIIKEEETKEVAVEQPTEKPTDVIQKRPGRKKA
jgi:hypothetical protein